MSRPRLTRIVSVVCFALIVGCASTHTVDPVAIASEDIELLGLSMKAVAKATKENVNAVAEDIRRQHLRAYVTREIEVAVKSPPAIEGNQPVPSIPIQMLLCEPFEHRASVETGRQFLDRLGTALSQSASDRPRENSIIGIVGEMGAKQSIDVGDSSEPWFLGLCRSSEDWAIKVYYSRGGPPEAGAVSVLAHVVSILEELLAPLLGSVADELEHKRRLDEAVRVLTDAENRKSVDSALGQLRARLNRTQIDGRARAIVEVIRARDGVVALVREAIEKEVGGKAGESRGPSACTAYRDNDMNSSLFVGCHDAIWGMAREGIDDVLWAAGEYDKFERDSTLLLGAVYRLSDLWVKYSDGVATASRADDLEFLALLMAGLLESVARLPDEGEGALEAGVTLNETLSQIIQLLFGPLSSST